MLTRAHHVCIAAAIFACGAAQAASADAIEPITQDMHWRLVGPHRGGRTRAVTGIPGQPHAVLIGAVNGGVWKTDDDGRTWRPIFDAAPTQSIGAIAVAPSAPNVIYVGTGEGLHRPDLSVGDGMYRSADGGLTWRHVGLVDAEQIPDVAVDPRNPEHLFAAVLGHPFGPSAERGIYASSDGGATWTQVLFKDENTGGSSVKIDAGDPDIVYASLWNVRSGPWEDKNVYNGTRGGLFKSVDGGAHWRQLKEGLPENLSQIEVAVAPNDPGRLYATVATSAPGGYSSAAGMGVYRSDDRGEHWRRITEDPRPALRIGGGDLPIIKVDPRNADVLYSASIVTVKSSDGGVHWTSLRGSPGGDDYQNLWIDPIDPARIALVSDQGALVSVNGGETWSSWFNQPTAQLYHIGITPTYPYRLCSGQQESGSVCVSTRGNDGEITFRDWHPVGVIEYGYVVPDPRDPDVIYGAGRNVVTRTRLSTGQVQVITPIPVKGSDTRFDRTEPLLFSPQDPQRMYYAANRLWVTTDAGNSWTPISPDLSREASAAPASVGMMFEEKADLQRGVIYSVSASPVARGSLWAGTDDGLIWVTTNEGGDWRNVTPPDLTPWSKVTQIEASHDNPLAAYAAVSRFRLDDLKPYLYRTRDGGKTWQLITAGLPDDAPADSVREDPARPGLLFAATEKAVWVSFDDGDHWHPLQLNLPHTSMRDLAIHGDDLIVATHGRGFWVLDDIAPLRQLDPEHPRTGSALLKPAVAIRARHSTNPDTPIPPDEPTGRNPPTGAVIDYFLASATKGPLTIELLDAQGVVIRRASSEDKDLYTPEEMQRELIPAVWIKHQSPLSTAAGVHRWIWDLHYPTPRAAQSGFPISAVPGDTVKEPLGPLAAPGVYRVRMTAGKHHSEEPLLIQPDPRVSIGPEAFAAQFALSQDLAGALDRSTVALLQCRSLRAQIKDVKPAAGSAPAASREALEHLLTTLQEGSVAAQAAESGGTPGASVGLERINGDLATLYDAVNSADTAPTQAQAAAAAQALGALQVLDVEWARALGGDVAKFNDALRRAHQHPLDLDLAPPRNKEFADEE